MMDLTRLSKAVEKKMKRLWKEVKGKYKGYVIYTSEGPHGLCAFGVKLNSAFLYSSAPEWKSDSEAYSAAKQWCDKRDESVGDG